MEVIQVKKSSIKPAVYNPRVDLQPGDAQYEKIKASIDKFGCVDPLVWNKRSGNLVGGHQRFKILIARGDEKFWVSVVDLCDVDEKVLNLALNKSLGIWDDEKLAELLKELNDAEYDLSVTGFESAEVDELLAMIEGPQEGRTDDDAVPDPPKKARTKTCDLWILGEHRLLCGDATKAEDVERVMNGGKATIVHTDPPYLVDYTGKDRPGDSGKDWSGTYKEIEIKDAEAFFEHALEHALEHAAFYWWHAHKRASLIERIWGNHSIIVHQQIIWVKPTALHGFSYYPWQHEPCYFGWLKGHKPNHDGDNSHAITSVWECDWEGKSRVSGNEHPTQKPIEIFSKPIRKHTKKGDICYEPFAGSGSQFIAAEKLGRRCFGLEIEPIYCDVIVKRWEEFTGLKAKLERVKPKPTAKKKRKPKNRKEKP